MPGRVGAVSPSHSLLTLGQPVLTLTLSCLAEWALSHLVTVHRHWANQFWLWPYHAWQGGRYLSQPQYSDTRPTSSGSDPIMPGKVGAVSPSHSILTLGWPVLTDPITPGRVGIVSPSHSILTLGWPVLTDPITPGRVGIVSPSHSILTLGWPVLTDPITPGRVGIVSPSHSILTLGWPVLTDPITPGRVGIVLPSHSILTLGWPVLTDPIMPGRVDATVPILKSVVWHHRRWWEAIPNLLLWRWRHCH